MAKMRKTTIARALRERAAELKAIKFEKAATFLNEIADGIESGKFKTATDVAQLAIAHTKSLV